MEEVCGESPTPNDYLYYSRSLLKNSKAELEEYFRSKIKNRKALLLDLIGTGHALHKFRGEGVIYSLLICCHLSKKFAENFHKAKGDLPEKWISFIDNPDTPEGTNDAFYFAGYEDGEYYIGQANEVFNRSTHNTPIRLSLIQAGEKILPSVLFSQVDDTENLDVFEACLHEVLNSKIYWSNLKRKDVLEQLLKFFAAMTFRRVFVYQQNLEDSMSGIISKYETK